jgi:hypothetical protein
MLLEYNAGKARKMKIEDVLLENVWGAEISGKDTNTPQTE